MSNLLIGYKKASGRVQRRLSHKINQENIWRSRLVLLTEGRDNWGRARWPPAVVSTFFGNLLEIVVVPHVEGGPAHGSGDGIRLSLGSLATQTILWFCDAMSADATKRLKKKQTSYSVFFYCIQVHGHLSQRERVFSLYYTEIQTSHHQAIYHLLLFCLCQTTPSLTLLNCFPFSFSLEFLSSNKMLPETKDFFPLKHRHLYNALSVKSSFSHY